VRRAVPVAASLAGVWLCLAPFGADSQPGLELFSPLATDRPIGFYIADPAGTEGALGGDTELCRWALADWARHSGGRLVFEPAAEQAALIRIYFAAPGFGQYGETRPIAVGQARGAEVYVRPDTNALGPEIAMAAAEDPLLREAIVYLTCLHEIGHALGLEHTAEFADVMYFFGYGGDIPGFFQRFRSRLASREDIRHESGLSPGDIARLRVLYPVD
jgi:hypothetical protein